MKPPADRELTKPGTADQLDPTAVQLHANEVVKVLKDGLGLGIFHNGVVFKDLALVGGVEKELHHGLGRVPTVIMALKVKYQAALTTINEGAAHADPRNKVNIRSGADTTVTVLIA